MRFSDQAVYGIFEAVHPSSSVDDWSLFLAKISVECVAQIYFGEDFEIRTVTEKLGNSSIIVNDEAWQSEKLVATGEAVMVYFDYQTNKAATIPVEVRERLAPITREK